MARPTWHKDKKETKIIINGEEWSPKSLLTSHNSDYAAASPAPKLPSFDDVMEDCYDGCMDEDIIKEVYDSIKKLGNFA